MNSENILQIVLLILDKEASKIFTQVSVTKREAEIKLDETDFYEKKMINKRKRLILEGKDPDEEEEREKKRLKEKKKTFKAKNKNCKLG